MKVLFAHGGPGLNSYAERAMLTEPARARGITLTCWNEPSRQRPDGWPYTSAKAYTGWLSSLERALNGLSAAGGPVHLWAHSFAAIPSIELCRRHASQVASLTLIAPSTRMDLSLRNAIALAAEDFEKAGDTGKSAALRAQLERNRRFLDEPLLKGLELALADPLLLTHYFGQLEQLQKAAAHLASPESAIDPASMFDVLREYAACFKDPAESAPVQTRMLLVLAEKEEICANDAERTVCRHIFPRRTEITVPGTGHFVHLDQPEAFLDAFIKFVSSAY